MAINLSTSLQPAEDTISKESPFASNLTVNKEDDNGLESCFNNLNLLLDCKKEQPPPAYQPVQSHTIP
jgi:hypothetical protein